jgi:Lysozyme like domain
MTASEIATVAENAGFTGDDLTTAVAVALAESSGNPSAFGDAGIGQGSFGLWQINSKYHPEYGPDFSTLYDPQANANAAFAVYSQAGNSFKPWSTFKTGAYLANVQVVLAQLQQVAGEAVQAVEDNPGSSGTIIALLLAFLFLSRR